MPLFYWRLMRLWPNKRRLMRRAAQYDKGGDAHYNLISALHKSVRGSDPDASLYWFARMLEGGEDPRYLARRITRMAVEDIGLADPQAQAVCLQSWETFERLGSPEGELALAQAVTYLALSPKSDAVYKAYNECMADIRKDPDYEVPVHLRNAPTALMKELGYGHDYRYAHDEPHAYAAGEHYLPDALANQRFYQPVDRGLEKKIAESGEGEADTSSHQLLRSNVTEEEIAELQRLQAKIIGFMAPPAQTFSRYPESDTSIPARYARAVAYYKQGLTDNAERAVNDLLELEPDNPYFHELKGQMLYESGFIDRSLEPYRRSIELLPDAPLLRIGYASALIATNNEANAREALGQLRMALVSEPQNPYAWFQRSLAHQQLGETAMAELSTAERAYAVGDEMQAHIFATRAHEELERGTEAWIRATEILAVTRPDSREMRDWNRRERERQPNFQHLDRGALLQP